MKWKWKWYTDNVTMHDGTISADALKSIGTQSLSNSSTKHKHDIVIYSTWVKNWKQPKIIFHLSNHYHKIGFDSSKG